MRPVELALTGFSSYREPQTISFEGVSLACITGHNGAGKSSMLQAMQFAMFGQVSGGDIDSIVNDTSTMAEVGFTFDHADSRYRITRTRSKGKKTSARLEREVDGEFIVVEASGVRAVDQEMDRLIRISPDTFSSTVLMAQEDSGRFAKASAAERKQILSEILGLDQYSELAKVARDNMRAERQIYTDTEAGIADIDTKLAGSDEDMRALMTAQTRLYELAPEIASARSQQEVAISAVTSSESAKNRLQAITEQILSLEAAIEKRRRELVERNASIKARADRADAALIKAKNLFDSIELAVNNIDGLITRQQEVSKHLGEAEESERNIVEEGVLAKGLSERETAEAERIEGVLTEVGERLTLLQHNHDAAECFTCHQALSDELRLQLIAGVENETRVLSEAASNARTRSAAAEARRVQLRADLGLARTAKDQAKAQLDRITRELTELQTLVSNKSAVIADLAAAESEQREARAELGAINTALADDESDETVAVLRSEAAALKSEISNASSLVSAKEAADRTLTALMQEEGQINNRIGTLTERIAGYEALRDSREAFLVKGAQAARDAEEWNVLVRAYGQDGVPNLVFAGAAQELEHDATDLMSKLTGGRYRLEMRTERINKGDGETIGALDIAVMTDSGQMRPFSRLSGGEKFRVALVLHTSLTRFLVRRSGSPIEFLGVDEGWGALDPEGIVAMLEALRTLHEEFPLILTITHTPEVAAAFECRYEVEKDSDGTSIVNLVAA